MQRHAATRSRFRVSPATPTRGSDPAPAVVIGGYTPGLAVIRALGSRGVPVVLVRYDSRDMGQASRWAREVLSCPHPERDQPAFLEFLADLAPSYPAAMLVPASDQALIAVVGHHATLAGLGFTVAAPSEQVAMACVDKARTYQLAEGAGVAVPRTVIVDSIEDVHRYAKQDEPAPGARPGAAPSPGFPAVLKPCVSHRYHATFQRKWTRVDSVEHAIAEVERAHAAGLQVILQELIPGDELCGANYNAYAWGGQVLVEMTAAKIRNSPAETGSPSVVVSRHLPDILASGRSLLGALGYDGFANIEFKRDPRDGVYKLIEVNARHNLSASLAWHCGVDFAWLQYRHLMHGELPTQPAAYREGLYWIDTVRDLKQAHIYLRRPDYSVRRFCQPYAAPHVSAVWHAGDPMPTVARAWDTLREAADAVAARAATRRERRAPEGVSRIADESTSASLEVVSSAAPSPESLAAWDALVMATPGSDVSQMSGWARLRARAGYQPLYLLAHAGPRLVGGALVLRRRVPGLGWVGYLPYGPVLATEIDQLDRECPDPTSRTSRDRLSRLLCNAIDELSRTHLALFVQPPDNCSMVSEDLLRRGFRASRAGIAPSATMRVDLTASEDDMRSRLPRRMRTWTRQWSRRGVNVRVGDHRDVPTLARLAAETATAQGFSPFPCGYLEQLYRELAPCGGAVLLLGEVSDTPVVAELLTASGGVLRSRITGLDRSSPLAGDAAKLNVAGAVIWEALRWGKRHGCHVYDFGGLRPESVAALSSAEHSGSAELAAPDIFKTKFGGQLWSYPTPVERIRSRTVRTGYDLLNHRAIGQKVLGTVRDVLRGTG